MEIIVKKNSDNIHLIELSGIMDLCGSEQIKEKVMGLIKNRIECFVIDLSRITFINSSGLGALIYVSSTLKKLKCPLALVVPDNPVMQALEITKMKNYFSIVASLKEAVRLVTAKLGEN